MPQVEQNIFAALCERLNALTLTPALAIAMPNTEYNPTSETPYLKVDDLPGEATQVTNGYKRYRGIFQVSVYWPEGQGIHLAKGVAGQIVEQFDVKTVLNQSGQIVRILAPPSIGPTLDEPGWTQLPVRIPYTSDASI